MSELLPITIISVTLACISHYFSRYDRIRLRYVRKDTVVYMIMAVVMILFVGLRTGYNDTGTYRRIYEAIPSDVDLFEGIDRIQIGDNPGFVLTNRILARLGFSTQSFLMFYAVITIGIYVWFIRRYSCNIWLSIFFMFVMGIFTFTLAAIKQCVAMAFCLLATDRAIRKKYVQFVFWILIAALYHPYSLIYLPVPLMMFRPWSGKTLVLIVFFGVVGIFLESLIGTVLSITDMMGAEYDANSFVGEGINPFRLAVIAVPALVALLTRRIIHSRNDRVNNLMVNLSMLNAEIMFVGLFGTANYFGRLANYFLIFQTIALPWLFTHFERKSRQLMTACAVVCYSLYFVYSNAIHESFDQQFYTITLVEYLQSLF